MLRTHSVLRHSLGGELEGPGRDEGFATGVRSRARSPRAVCWGNCSRCGPARCCRARQPDWCAGYLSGLLIGSEIGANREWIGDARSAADRLGQRFARFMARRWRKIGVRSRLVDATEAVLAGLKAARQFSS